MPYVNPFLCFLLKVIFFTMATVAFFIVTIVIIAECQSQDNNDYVSTKETIIEPTEVVETSVHKKETIVKNNDTNCPVTQMKTNGPVNLYIHGAFATTNKGKFLIVLNIQLLMVLAFNKILVSNNLKKIRIVCVKGISDVKRHRS